MSNRIMSLKVVRFFPLTCHRPVRPGAVSNRSRVPLVVFLRFIRQARPRPHQAHVAPQHVDQLGKLVQAGLAQDPPQGDDAGVFLRVQLDHRLVAALDEGLEVLLVRRRVVVDLHRPEFPAFELLPPETDPFLAEEDRPGVRDLDIDGDQQEERGKEDQRDQGEKHVENVLPERQLPDEDRRHHRIFRKGGILRHGDRRDRRHRPGFPHVFLARFGLLLPFSLVGVDVHRDGRDGDSLRQGGGHASARIWRRRAPPTRSGGRPGRSCRTSRSRRWCGRGTTARSQGGTACGRCLRFLPFSWNTTNEKQIPVRSVRERSRSTRSWNRSVGWIPWNAAFLRNQRIGLSRSRKANGAIATGSPPRFSPNR